MSEQKFCIDCVHFIDKTEAFGRDASLWQYGCKRFSTIVNTDLVTGYVTTRHPEIDARKERKHFNHGLWDQDRCGPEGKYWVRK